LIPEENVRDLAEIPDNIKNKLEIIPVKWIDQVFEHALERKPEPASVEEPAPHRSQRPPRRAWPP
jgi:ATP-dependent Lon protease